MPEGQNAPFFRPFVWPSVRPYVHPSISPFLHSLSYIFGIMIDSSFLRCVSESFLRVAVSITKAQYLYNSKCSFLSRSGSGCRNLPRRYHQGLYTGAYYIILPSFVSYKYICHQHQRKRNKTCDIQPWFLPLNVRFLLRISVRYHWYITINILVVF